MHAGVCELNIVVHTQTEVNILKKMLMVVTCNSAHFCP